VIMPLQGRYLLHEEEVTAGIAVPVEAMPDGPPTTSSPV
jgi:hypothetical protein